MRGFSTQRTGLTASLPSFTARESAGEGENLTQHGTRRYARVQAPKLHCLDPFDGDRRKRLPKPTSVKSLEFLERVVRRAGFRPRPIGFVDELPER